ncbi:MFS general substrate transporter [Sanghuangporus baumii]|uniref:MFS general substrate transporter n=1 Tax=Sanghuangporus baumii TaxID=108892 RepID=A0A9Q5I5Q8_SANBA|nr:MFS general substrate transporter [Sanghuangporus baumii]
MISKFEARCLSSYSTNATAIVMPAGDVHSTVERDVHRQSVPALMTRIRALSETEQQTLTDSPRTEKIESPDVERSPRSEPGMHWSQTEVYEIRHNNMLLVFSGLMLTVFLAALDQTIASVALPAIVRDIGGESAYSWVGSAYLLTSACICPLFGTLSDIIGRKPILFFSITIFLLGSALCGAAQNVVRLVVCRAVQGIGGGGIVQMSMIVSSDITTLEERGTYGGLIQGTWDHVSWRWCFWINLPTGGAAAIVLFFFLHLNPVRQVTLREAIASFDFFGLFFITASTILILIGFQFADTAQKRWRAPQTISTLVLGGILFIAGGVFEVYTSREPVIPPRLFHTRATTAILISSFIHSFTFIAVTYYVPLYFQILGSNATIAGVQTLPILVGSSLMSILSGFIVSAMGRYRPIMVFGFLVMTLGYGLLIMLDEDISIARQEIWLLVAGLGIGCFFQPPLIGLQSAMPVKDMATSTSAFSLIRNLGGAMGLAVGSTIFQSELSNRLDKIPEYSSLLNSDSLDYTSIHRIEPDALRQQISHAFTRSLAMIYIVFTPISFVGLLFTLLTREYTLKRIIEREPKRRQETMDESPGRLEQVIVTRV